MSAVITPDQLVYVATNLGLGGAVLYVFYKYLDKLDELTKTIQDLKATQEKFMMLLDILINKVKE